MADMKSAADILSALMLGGLMGLIGQGARAVVGLKKMNDAMKSAPDESDFFSASRLIFSLLIGFIAGVIAAISTGISSLITIDVNNLQLLLGLAAAGYAGTDFIEGFQRRITFLPGSDATSAQSTKAVGRSAVDDGTKNLQLSSVRAAAAPTGLGRDIEEAKKYLAAISEGAKTYSLSPSLICSIGSRESGWGIGSDMRPKGPAGTGDWAPRNAQRWGYSMPPDGLGWGRGLLQIDYQDNFAKTGPWQDPHENILHGCAELAGNIAYYTKNSSAGIDPQRAGIAAYNCGRGNVNKAIKQGKDIDVYTANHNYSQDTMNRMVWFKQQGFDDLVG